MDDATTKLLRAIPAVSEFLTAPEGQRLTADFGEGLVKWQLREALDLFRTAIREGHVTTPSTIPALAALLRQSLRRLTDPAARRAINATGILLHTGLGRAPLCPAALAALAAAAGATPLQASLESGDRSLREARVEKLLQELTGCAAATVVNNNAAATLLILNTLAAGREAIISRGQLIEIGGSFRMTDVMAQSGAILREVGTTNRTHLRDYQSAITDRTAALVHVHTSNYRIRGFTGTPPIAELASLAHQRGLLALDDLGSGALVSLREWGLSDEPLIKDSLAAGSDVVWFSGDKLIGGPQAGLICGRKDLVAQIRKNPFARMFRVDKLTLAALEATLMEFIQGTFRQNLPLYQMLGQTLPALEALGQGLLKSLADIPTLTVELASDLAYIGSGSIPDEGLPTRVLKIRHSSIPAAELARRLRFGIPAVFGRLADRELLLDLRTLRPNEGPELVAALLQAVDSSPEC